MVEGAAQDVGEWVLLSYRLPREPSTPRISLWRRLKRLGALQIGDGLAALPADARTREQLEWLAEEALEAGGTATTWSARPGSLAQERAMATSLAAERAAEYREIAIEANALAKAGAPASKDLARLRKAWRDTSRRDYFPPVERELASQAINHLAAAAVAVPADAVPGSRSTAGTPS